MSNTNNPLPDNLQPNGDLCIPVSLPDNSDWLWLVAKCLSFPTAERFWKKGNIADIETLRAEWDARVYHPFVKRILNIELCQDIESNNCIEYPTSSTDIINFSPINPYLEPNVIPSGFLFPPFIRYGALLPEWIPDVFQDYFDTHIEALTGYEPTDILTLAGSFPFITNWFNGLLGNLPRFTINVTGKGRLLLHLLQVPLGGRALITVDIELSIPDIIDGLITENYKMIELERDEVSIPSEKDFDHIEEILIDTDGLHTIYVTYLPVIDIDEIPLKYGGGIRSVEWCPESEIELPIDCNYIRACLEASPDNIAHEAITVTNMEATTQNFLDELNNLYDGTNPNSINPSIPTIAPDTTQKGALCWAIENWLSLYAHAKMMKIRQAGFLSQVWSGIQTAIVGAYGVLNNNLGWLVPDGLFGCFVSNSAALDGLTNATAMGDVKCALYNELKDIALLETSIEGAINAVLTQLTGTANDIACLLDNDYSEASALNFFYLYGRALDNALSGDCSACEPIVDENWAYTLDLTEPLPAWVQVLTGTWTNGVGVTSAAAGSPLSASINIQLNLNEYYSMRQVSVEYERSSDGSTFDWFRVTGFVGTVNNQRQDWLTYDEPIHGYQLTTYCNPIPGIASAAKPNWIFQWIDYGQPSNTMIAKKIKFWTDLQTLPPSPIPDNSEPVCL